MGKQYYNRIREIVVLITLLLNISSAAHNSYEIEITESPLISNEVIIKQSIMTIENVSCQNIWILIEKDTSLTNKELINRRFKYRNEGDMSLFQWMVDGNVNWSGFVLRLDSTFFKILAPGLTFTMISVDNPMYELIEYIRIISGEEMKELFNALSTLPPDTTPSYQPDVIYIPLLYQIPVDTLSQ